MYWGWSQAPVPEFGGLRVGFKCRGGGGPPPPFDSTLRRGDFQQQPAAAAAATSSNQQQQQQPAAAAAAQQSRKQQVHSGSSNDSNSSSSKAPKLTQVWPPQPLAFVQFLGGCADEVERGGDSKAVAAVFRMQATAATSNK